MTDAGAAGAWSDGPRGGEAFDLLRELYGDREMSAVFSARRLVDSWVAVEAALATAQGELGVIDSDRANAILKVCADPEVVDREALWESARTVGYPILGLVRQLDAALPEALRGSVHFGATTQDIMDSALALQLDAGADIVERRLTALAQALVAQIEQHARTVMPGRTHAQQAVPTTLGAKFAVYLDEVRRHRERLLGARDDARRVSLFGAGGTSAALGGHARETRTRVAEQLGLVDAEVPWHVARDGVVHLASVLVGASTTAARLAREVTDLARTEIAEIGEAVGHHRGASSTMPQKANPIWSESIIGFAVSARSALAGLSRAAEAGHERSAGEWQVEWVLLPGIFVNVASALSLAADLVNNLAVYPERMLANLDADGGLILSESVMISLAPHLGREDAHDVVYEMAQRARATGRSLSDLVSQWLGEHPEIPPIALTADLTSAGEATRICEVATAQWSAHRTDNPRPWKDNP